MSDFLDRLAARAIGSETALAPRLPSLFEPLQRAPIMPLPDQGEAPLHRREAAPAAPQPPAIAASPRAPAHAREPGEPPAATRVASREPQHAAPSAARTAAVAPREPVRPLSRAVPPVRTGVAEPVGKPPAPEHPAALHAPIPPQPSRMVPARKEAVPMPAPTGVLLPAPAPVFAASGAAPTRPERSVAARAAAAQSGRGAASATEPVVHVSIGRLEVRAAPATAAPAQRREGPRPSSLDDYLRQRGKGSP